jgi:hypothetical protein
VENSSMSDPPPKKPPLSTSAKNEQVAALISPLDSGRMEAAPALSSASSIFISYRRGDSEDIVERLYERLASIFGPEAILNLHPRFAGDPPSDVSKSRVFVCMIGEQWVGSSGATGRLIDDPDDPVRQGIEVAIRDDMPIVPVLVGGMRIPSSEFFSGSMSHFVQLYFLQIRRDPHFESDMERVAAAVRRCLK